MAYELLPQLKVALKHRHLSVRAAARDMGVSFSALAKIVRGETATPSVHTHWRIAHFVGLPAPPCPCARCTGKEQEGDAHLAGEVQQLDERLERVERLLARALKRMRTRAREDVCSAPQPGSR